MLYEIRKLCKLCRMKSENIASYVVWNLKTLQVMLCEIWKHCKLCRMKSKNFASYVVWKLKTLQVMLYEIWKLCKLCHMKYENIASYVVWNWKTLQVTNVLRPEGYLSGFHWGMKCWENYIKFAWSVPTFHTSVKRRKITFNSYNYNSLLYSFS